MKKFLGLNSFLGALAILVVGCGESSVERSTFKFSIPQSMQKVEGQNTKLRVCIAVDIVGPGISKSDATTCDPQYGEFFGLFEADAEIELKAPRGSDRNIRLYYIETTGSCAGRDRALGLGAFGTNRVHEIANLENVDLLSDNEEVTLAISPKSDANMLGAIHELPSSCHKELGESAGASNVARTSTSIHHTSASDAEGNPRGMIHMHIGNKSILSKSSNTTAVLKPEGMGESR